MTAVLLALVGVVAVASFFAARQRAMSVVNGDTRVLHSRPSFHGLLSMIWVIMAGFGLVIVLTIVPNAMIDSTLLTKIAADLPNEPNIVHQLVLSDAKALATGEIASKTDDLRQEIAAQFSRKAGFWGWVRVVAVIGGAMAAAFMTLRVVSADRRARNRSETIIQFLLACMATIAVLTTVGIVLSLIFNVSNSSAIWPTMLSTSSSMAA